MRDHRAYGLVVCPSSATVSSSTEAANRAVHCVWPAGAWAERALCVCGGWGGGGAGNAIGAEGAAAVARALESGRCGLTSLKLDGEWGALVLRVAYHRAALYRCAVLGCCQPRFVTVLVTVRWYLGKNGSNLMGMFCCAVLQCAVPSCTAFNMCTVVTVSVSVPGICTKVAVLSSVSVRPNYGRSSPCGTTVHTAL